MKFLDDEFELCAAVARKRGWAAPRKDDSNAFPHRLWREYWRDMSTWMRMKTLRQTRPFAGKRPQPPESRYLHATRQHEEKTAVAR